MDNKVIFGIIAANLFPSANTHDFQRLIQYMHSAKPQTKVFAFQVKTNNKSYINFPINHPLLINFPLLEELNITSTEKGLGIKLQNSFEVPFTEYALRDLGLIANDSHSKKDMLLKRFTMQAINDSSNYSREYLQTLFQGIDYFCLPTFQHLVSAYYDNETRHKKIIHTLCRNDWLFAQNLRKILFVCNMLDTIKTLTIEPMESLEIKSLNNKTFILSKNLIEWLMNTTFSDAFGLYEYEVTKLNMLEFALMTELLRLMQTANPEDWNALKRETNQKRLEYAVKNPKRRAAKTYSLHSPFKRPII